MKVKDLKKQLNTLIKLNREVCRLDITNLPVFIKVYVAGQEVGWEVGKIELYKKQNMLVFKP